MSKSIIQKDKERCFLCGGNGGYFGLDEHHVYPASNRKKSEHYGLKVYICHDKCHLNGVHKNAELNNALKRQVQQIAMEHYGWTIEQFREKFGKSWM